MRGLKKTCRTLDKLALFSTVMITPFAKNGPSSARPFGLELVKLAVTAVYGRRLAQDACRHVRDHRPAQRAC